MEDNMKKFFLGVVMILFLSSTFIQSETISSIPQLINYQGMLTNTQGEPLETKEYKLSFSIFDQATRGTELWGPQLFDGTSGEGHGEKIPVVRGHFNVILGPKDSKGKIISEAFVNREAYLQITVEDNSPIFPRQQVLSAPYSLYSIHGVPTGTISAYWGNYAPFGWLLCNGQAIPQGNMYEKLRKMTGNNLPDLRGMFLRGINNGRNDEWSDPVDRKIGDFQSQATKLPKNPFKTEVSGNHRHELTGWRYRDRRDDPGYFGHLESRPGDDRHYTGYDGKHSHTISEGGDKETRPNNITINWIIKY